MVGSAAEDEARRVPFTHSRTHARTHTRAGVGGGGWGVQLRIGYDGWDESYDFECSVDDGNFQPPGTCLRAGSPHPNPQLTT